jgi:hypothetical protein
MKVLIACSTCWKDKKLGANAAIRETWGKTLPEGWDLRFFLGGSHSLPEEDAKFTSGDWIGSPGTLGIMDVTKRAKNVIGTEVDCEPDEVILLNAGDSYLSLPWKTTESLKWGLDRDYDFIVRIFVDTYLLPARMAESQDLWQHDAAGWSFGCGPCPAHPDSFHSCPLGGAAYTTSRKASEAVVNEPIRHWGEDTHCGFALANAGIPIFDDDRFKWDFGVHPAWNKQKFSIHLCDRGRRYNPIEMVQAHNSANEGFNAFPEWDGKCAKCGHIRFRHGLYGPVCRHCGWQFNAGIRTTR